jgi:acyl dehydratase
VLANYGLDSLRFIKPIQPGETIKVRLTAKDKSPRNKQYGSALGCRNPDRQGRVCRDLRTSHHECGPASGLIKKNTEKP